MKKVIAYFCLVNIRCINHGFIVVNLIPALGFSRGAYQVRVIAGMIEKVRLFPGLGYINDRMLYITGWSPLQRQ